MNILLSIVNLDYVAEKCVGHVILLTIVHFFISNSSGLTFDHNLLILLLTSGIKISQVEGNPNSQSTTYLTVYVCYV